MSYWPLTKQSLTCPTFGMHAFRVSIELPPIDTQACRHSDLICFVTLIGIPDEAGIRSKAWKVLLGYLPADKRQWKEVFSDQRKSYYVIVFGYYFILKYMFHDTHHWTCVELGCWTSQWSWRWTSKRWPCEYDPCQRYHLSRPRVNFGSNLPWIFL